MSELKFPTEMVELPSKGLVYPEDNPLSSGQIEMKYMTAKEEDILTNQNYINNGTVIDELLKSLIITKINYNDLIVGDKNAIMIAARVLGYGKDYSFTYDNDEQVVDLSLLEPTDFDESLYSKGKNEFSFTLPTSNIDITYKLLTHGDDKKIANEIKGLKKLNKLSSPELSTRLKHMLLSVNGDVEKKTIVTRAKSVEQILVEECTGEASSAYPVKSFIDCLEALSAIWVNLEFVQMVTDDLFICKMTHGNTVILLCPLI